ncbi:putative kynurenine alpha-aminoadipate aminotransferase [Lyophyllum shimeji]|uniref:Kynurenine alpha-aminoadipate aminotransferase n=1 Tax=Lyophyllum shimeji TaxID=47721 RepID=A0A9P3PQA8_LYOSH|nr:putative kynurenine alpha-aminoadipate aminotransferase [Lyophyllum shimeji]
MRFIKAVMKMSSGCSPAMDSGLRNASSRTAKSRRKDLDFTDRLRGLQCTFTIDFLTRHPGPHAEPVKGFSNMSNGDVISLLYWMIYSDLSMPGQNIQVTHSDGICEERITPNSVKSRVVKTLPADYYTKFLSDNAKNRKPSPSEYDVNRLSLREAYRFAYAKPVRSLFPLEQTPGLISLLAGKPNPSTFPFTSFSFSARSPLDDNIDVVLKLSDDELAEGLQYGATAGYEPLRQWMYGLQEAFHGRNRNEGWGLSIGSGSQDLIYKARGSV